MFFSLREQLDNPEPGWLSDTPQETGLLTFYININTHLYK
jgi:hypothetical protein